MGLSELVYLVGCHIVDDGSLVLPQFFQNEHLTHIFQSIYLISQFCGILQILRGLVQDYVTDLKEMRVIQIDQFL